MKDGGTNYWWKMLVCFSETANDNDTILDVEDLGHNVTKILNEPFKFKCSNKFHYERNLTDKKYQISADSGVMIDDNVSFC